MKKILTILLAVMALVACTEKAVEQQQQKVLVLYYSQTGATKTVAEELKKQLGADIETIELENDYTDDFQKTIERCQKEKENGVLPEVKPLKANLDDYDVIFLGYPIWFGTYATPIESLLKTGVLRRKDIVPFCTFGSGGLQASTEDLRKYLVNAKVSDGYGIRHDRIEAAAEEINRYLIENGYKEGSIEPLPEFGEHHPVTDEEKKIFDKACGNYQYPLGKPESVAGRTVPGAVEYEFTATSSTNGLETTSTIYVLVPKEGDKKPVFTQVVR